MKKIIMLIVLVIVASAIAGAIQAIFGITFPNLLSMSVYNIFYIVVGGTIANILFRFDK